MNSELNIINESELTKICKVNEIWGEAPNLIFLEFKRSIDHSRQRNLYSVISVSKTKYSYLVTHLFKNKKRGDWEPVMLYTEAETEFTNHDLFNKIPTDVELNQFKEKSLWENTDSFKTLYQQKIINQLN